MLNIGAGELLLLLLVFAVLLGSLSILVRATRRARDAGESARLRELEARLRELEKRP
ncbi:hypothetical protein DEIPH_ctg079orf0008 [Deinococcus phoenicis]|uniref:Uncharacterized protein n=1 Tax=Deinococcus phoenicis TaxID=1476583 RepID=A0A016QLI9_9DEIO|nr:hypothetical protein [Deinococcus phoenicis]EYB66629.1 hypothetical protein DEIPH_ctg079orf0008 [Deinococcus phoenicis]